MHPRRVVCTLYDPFLRPDGRFRQNDAVTRVIGVPGRLPLPKPESRTRPRRFIAYFPGFNSVRTSTKPNFLLQKCIERSSNGSEDALGFLALDYSGHGDSAASPSSLKTSKLSNEVDDSLRSLAWEECGLDVWAEDAVSATTQLIQPDPLSPTELYLVGTSMGAHIAVLAAHELLRVSGLSIKGLLLLAPAFDFASRLPGRMSQEQRIELNEKGKITVDSAYDPKGYVITRRLLDSANALALLDRSDRASQIQKHLRGIPVSFLWAADDPDVPVEAFNVARQWFATQKVTVLDSGGHRLSGPAELAAIWRVLESLMKI